MVPIACVVVPALPLQILLQHHPDWVHRPTVVVAQDRPQAKILWANALARRARITTGMTYAAARNLAGDLRASVVHDERIAQVTGDLFVILCGYSPRVEPVTDEPGAYWLDPAGMVPLYGSLQSWAQTVHDDLHGRGFETSTVLGFHRFRTHILARFRTGIQVLSSPDQERRLANALSLYQTRLSPPVRAQLMVLGVNTVGDLLAIAEPELRARFGLEAARLHQQAADGPVTLAPRSLVDPIVETIAFEPPEFDHPRLLFAIRRGLHPLLSRLAARGQALCALHLGLKLDHAPGCTLAVAPAQPTLDDGVLVDLIRLRLEAVQLPAALVELRLELEGVRVHSAQLALFHGHAQGHVHRDLDAGARALARIKATFGPGCVTRPVLRAAHLPEARFAWEPTQRLIRPGPMAEPHAPMLLQRRLLTPKVPLPARPRHEPERWLGSRGVVTRLFGPHRISGGWWVRTVERDYYYALTQRGSLLWIYFDRPRQRWYLHGVVD